MRCATPPVGRPTAASRSHTLGCRLDLAIASKLQLLPSAPAALRWWHRNRAPQIAHLHTKPVSTERRWNDATRDRAPFRAHLTCLDRARAPTALTVRIVPRWQAGWSRFLQLHVARHRNMHKMTAFCAYFGFVAPSSSSFSKIVFLRCCHFGLAIDYASRSLPSNAAYAALLDSEHRRSFLFYLEIWFLACLILHSVAK